MDSKTLLNVAEIHEFHKFASKKRECIYKNVNAFITVP